MRQKIINFRDPVVERVVDKFVERSDVGFEKYGVTLRMIPQRMLAWLNHLQEETHGCSLVFTESQRNNMKHRRSEE
jgi:hypothetical protein